MKKIFYETTFKICMYKPIIYFQLPIKIDDRYKTAFISDFGLYHFKQILQELKNLETILQRIINNLFSDYIRLCPRI